ncbi:hypothetical protein AAIG11_03410 [Anoxynatronum sibiricum]|uniref:Uncharacterized protein n=2 Tax=Anoxynatronum sibiricum TaxID=210623 RepID=A0ABU9VQR6_9CLOT
MIWLLIFLMATTAPWYYLLRSVLVMWPYSLHHQKMSLINKNEYYLDIPTNQSQKDDQWHPLMLVYHDETGFDRWKGEPWALTVLYRFGGFSPWQRNASYFDHTSPRFSSFYGAYLVQHKQTPELGFGFDKDGNFDPDQWISVTEYDQRFLVMPSMGLNPENVTFDIEIEKIESDVTYVGRKGWTQIDASIFTNSPQHVYQKHQRGYLQYGNPLPPQEGHADFEIIKLYGRFYAIFEKEYELSLGLYLLAPDREILEQIDREELSRMILPEW